MKTAADLFGRRGHSGTGLDGIVATCDAPKSSLYHYFPDGKLSIAEAVVRATAANVTAIIEELVWPLRPAGKVVPAYADPLAGWRVQPKFSNGCPITTLLLDTRPAMLP